MAAPDTQALRALLARFASDPAIAPLTARLEAADGAAALETLYEEALALIQERVWAAGCGAAGLAQFQDTYRELETLIAGRGDDRRHRFIIVIPVADRPQHLTNILESLQALCLAYGYGGRRNGRFAKVAVLIADDSREAAHIAHNREVIERFRGEGLDVRYFGAEEQAQELARLDADTRAALAGVLGFPERSGFRHKGASVNRNLAYLPARRIADEQACPALFYFVDSDEQFRVRAADGRDLLAVNYLHALDRIFRAGTVRVLTGKVVGDPPVSPAVMAGNFLDDVAAFLEQMAAAEAQAPCRFHDDSGRRGADAGYHDMADLFGFAPPSTAQRYRCRLAGAHDHAHAFADFAERLDRFFHGEHPTRTTDFEAAGPLTATVPARTVYTGNYICDRRALAYFVPFAPLRLRMAGPTLGRVVQAELGAGFVSANLPLLHTRAVEGEAQFEFRPGVERAAAGVDLSGEFERQFFGDVMLFTMERLVATGYPRTPLPEATIRAALEAVEADLHAKYLTKQAQIAERLARARALFAGARWWNSQAALAPARARFETFFDNIERNFAPEAPAYRLIGEGENRNRRREAILQALLGYGADRRAWARLLPEPIAGESKR